MTQGEFISLQMLTNMNQRMKNNTKQSSAFNFSKVFEKFGKFLCIYAHEFFMHLWLTNREITTPSKEFIYERKRCSLYGKCWPSIEHTCEWTWLLWDWTFSRCRPQCKSELKTNLQHKFEIQISIATKANAFSSK